MSVMVPLQLKFIEGKTNSVFLVSGLSRSLFLEKSPYKLMVALGTNPRAHSIKSTVRQDVTCAPTVLVYMSDGVIALHREQYLYPSFPQQIGRRG